MLHFVIDFALDEHSRTLQNNSNAITKLDNSLCILKKTLKNDISIEFEGLFDDMLKKFTTLQALLDQEKEQRMHYINKIMQLEEKQKNLEQELMTYKSFGESRYCTLDKNLIQLNKNLIDQTDTVNNCKNALALHTTMMTNCTGKLLEQTNKIGDIKQKLINCSDGIVDQRNKIATLTTNVDNHSNTLIVSTNRLNTIEQTLTNHTNILGDHTTTINDHTNSLKKATDAILHHYHYSCYELHVGKAHNYTDRINPEVL